MFFTMSTIKPNSGFGKLFGVTSSSIMMSLLLLGASRLLPFESTWMTWKSNGSNSLASAAVPVVDTSVPEIAEAVTVRVFGNSGVSSGVLISRRGNTYQVLTCDHCIDYNRDRLSGEGFEVLTPDGLRHTATFVPLDDLQGFDLAVLEFSSSRNYPIAERANPHQLSVGDVVYVSGFPRWHWLSQDNIADTSDWGWDAYHLTRGELQMVLNLPLVEGYSLGYTNDIELGMSGGPIFNDQGHLIGVNGRSKYPWTGINSFTFVDGSRPSRGQFGVMESLSWGIPLNEFDSL